jgi:hypothetical protein
VRRKVCTLPAGHEGRDHVWRATTSLAPHRVGECDAKAPCPECGAPLDVVTDGLVGTLTAPAFHVRGHELPIVMRPTPFLACSGCEYCKEIRTR